MAAGLMLPLLLIVFGIVAIERWRRRTVEELRHAARRDERRRQAWDDLAELDRAA